MTNQERYRRMCERLHASHEAVLEVTPMKKQANRLRIGRAIAVAACTAALLTGTAFAANTATDGALFEQVRCWVNGEETALTYHEDGDYYEFESEDGSISGKFSKDGSTGEVNYDGDAASETEGEENTEITVQFPDFETTVTTDPDAVGTDAEDYKTASGSTVTEED